MNFTLDKLHFDTSCAGQFLKKNWHVITLN